MTGYHVRIMN